VIEFLITYGIPAAFALVAGYMKYREQKATGSVDILTTAIELFDSKEVKDIVARLSKDTPMEGVIEKSLEKLDLVKIKEYIKLNKKLNKK